MDLATLNVTFAADIALLQASIDEGRSLLESFSSTAAGLTTAEFRGDTTQLTTAAEEGRGQLTSFQEAATGLGAVEFRGDTAGLVAATDEARGQLEAFKGLAEAGALVTFSGDDAPLMAAIGEAEGALSGFRATADSEGNIILSADSAPLMAGIAEGESAISGFRATADTEGNVVLSADTAPLMAGIAEGESAIAGFRDTADTEGNVVLSADTAPLMAALGEADAAMVSFASSMTEGDAGLATFNASLAESIAMLGEFIAKLAEADAAMGSFAGSAGEVESGGMAMSNGMGMAAGATAGAGEEAAVAEGKFGGMGKEVEGLGGGVSSLAGATGLLALAAAFGITGDEVLKSNMQLEKTSTALNTLSGDAAGTQGQLQAIADMGLEEGFSIPGLEKADQKLVATGMAADQVIPTLKSVAEATVSVGTGQEGIDAVVDGLQRMETSGTVTNRTILTLVKNGIPIYKELADVLGTDVAGAMDAVKHHTVDADQVMQAMQENEGRMGDQAEAHAHTFEGSIGRIAAAIEELSVTGFKPFYDGVTGVANAIADYLVGIASATTSTEAFTAAFGPLAPIAEGAVAVFDALYNGVVSFWGGVGSLTDSLGFLTPAVDYVVEGFRAWWPVLEPLVEVIAGPLSMGLVAVATILTGQMVVALAATVIGWLDFGTVLGMTMPAILLIGIAIGAAIEIWQNWGAVSEWLGETFGSLGDILASLGDSISSGMDSVLSFIGDIAQGIDDSLGGLPGDLLQIGVDIVGGLIEGLVAGAQAVVDTAVNIANSVIDVFAQVLQIASPSRRMHEAGHFTSTGFHLGMHAGHEAHYAMVHDDVQHVATLVTANPTLSTLPAVGHQRGAAFGQGLHTGISAAHAPVATAAGQLGSAAGSHPAITSLPSVGQQRGAGFGQGLHTSIAAAHAPVAAASGSLGSAACHHPAITSLGTCGTTHGTALGTGLHTSIGSHVAPTHAVAGTLGSAAGSHPSITGLGAKGTTSGTALGSGLHTSIGSHVAPTHAAAGTLGSAAGSHPSITGLGPTGTTHGAALGAGVGSGIAAHTAPAHAAAGSLGTGVSSHPALTGLGAAGTGHGAAHGAGLASGLTGSTGGVHAGAAGQGKAVKGGLGAGAGVGEGGTLGDMGAFAGGDLGDKLKDSITSKIPSVKDAAYALVKGIADAFSSVFDPLVANLQPGGKWNGILGRWIKAETGIDIPGFAAWIDRNVRQPLNKFFADFQPGGAYNGILATGLSHIVAQIGTGLGAVVTKVQDAWDKVSQVTSDIWGATLGPIVDYAWLIIQASVLLGTTIVSSYVSDAWQSVSDTTSSIWTSISDFFSSSWASLTGTAQSGADAVDSSVSSGWQSASDTTSSTWTSIGDFFSTWWDWLNNTLIQPALQALGINVDTSWQSISDTTTSVWTSIKDFFSATWDEIKTIFWDTVSAIETFLSDAWSSISTIATDGFHVIAHAIVDPMVDAVNTVMDIISGLGTWLAGELDSWGVGADIAGKLRAGAPSHVANPLPFAEGGIRDASQNQSFATGGVSSGMPGYTDGRMVEWGEALQGDQREYFLTEAPQHADRNQGLWAEYGQRMGFATGGVSSSSGSVTQNINVSDPNANIQKIANTGSGPLDISPSQSYSSTQSVNQTSPAAMGAPGGAGGVGGTGGTGGAGGVAGGVTGAPGALGAPGVSGASLGATGGTPSDPGGPSTILDFVNTDMHDDDTERIALGNAGLLPPAPSGYIYAEDSTLIPGSGGGGTPPVWATADLVSYVDTTLPASDRSILANAGEMPLHPSGYKYDPTDFSLVADSTAAPTTPVLAPAMTPSVAPAAAPASYVYPVDPSSMDIATFNALPDAERQSDYLAGTYPAIPTGDTMFEDWTIGPSYSDTGVPAAAPAASPAGYVYAEDGSVVPNSFYGFATGGTRMGWIGGRGEGLGATTYDWAPEMQSIVDREQATYSTAANTYVAHGELGGSDEQDTADFWGMGGRGDPIDPGTGDSVLADIWSSNGADVMYYIWSGTEWRYDQGSMDASIYNGDDLHYDHVHVSLFPGGTPGPGGAGPAGGGGIGGAVRGALTSGANAILGGASAALAPAGVVGQGLAGVVSSVGKSALGAATKAVGGGVGSALGITGGGGGDYNSLIEQYFPADAVSMAETIMGRESGGDPSALNASGASGLFQIMPDTASGLGGDPSQLFDPSYNIQLAAQLYAQQGWGPWSETAYANGGLIAGNNPHVGLVGEGPHDEAIIPLPQGINDFVSKTNAAGGDTAALAAEVSALRKTVETQHAMDRAHGTHIRNTNELAGVGVATAHAAMSSDAGKEIMDKNISQSLGFFEPYHGDTV